VMREDLTAFSYTGVHPHIPIVCSDNGVGISELWNHLSDCAAENSIDVPKVRRQFPFYS
jgi:hypothetical protein